MPDEQKDARRGFLKLVTAAVSSVVGALTAVPALGFLAHPLRRKTIAGDDEAVRVASAGDLHAGKPQRVSVYGRRQDAWLRLDRVKLGAVWLLKTAEGR